MDIHTTQVTRQLAMRPHTRATLAGRDDRLAAIRRGLAEADVAAILCAWPSNVLLLSGYWPVIGDTCAVVRRDGPSHLIVPADEATDAAHSWADTVRTFPSPPPTTDAGTAMLAAALRGDTAIPPGARIMVERGPALEPSSYVGMHLYGTTLADALGQAYPHATLVSADPLLARLRAHKTKADIAHIRAACRIVGRALRSVICRLRVGRSERSVAAQVRGSLTIGAPTSARRADGFAFCMSGANAARASGAFAHSSAKRLERGDLILIHCNSYIDGYWTDVTRTYCLGKPNARVRAMYEAVFAARAAALAAITPGARGRDVDRAARDVLTDHGFGPAFKHSTGHGVGFAAIDASARPQLSPTSDDILESGMVCNVEPAIYIDGVGGLRHCDMIAVTSTGASLLTPFLNEPEELTL